MVSHSMIYMEVFRMIFTPPRPFAKISIQKWLTISSLPQAKIWYMYFTPIVSRPTWGVATLSTYLNDMPWRQDLSYEHRSKSALWGKRATNVLKWIYFFKIYLKDSTLFEAYQYLPWFVRSTWSVRSGAQCLLRCFFRIERKGSDIVSVSIVFVSFGIA